MSASKTLAWTCLMAVLTLGFALAACAGTPAQQPISGPGPAAKPKVSGTPSTVAVWDLDDLSPTASPDPNLGEVLSGKVIEALEKKGTYTIVERQRLVLALEELNLGSTSLADESTRLRLGKLVGAQRMIFGSYQVIGGRMRLDLRLVDVETARVVKASEKTVQGADLRTWFKAAQEAAEELL